MSTMTCYCPHHADGDENCDNCIGCKASSAATKGLAQKIVARFKLWRKQYDEPSQGGMIGAVAQSAIDSAIRLTEQEGHVS